jgi:hypothetical protein
MPGCLLLANRDKDGNEIVVPLDHKVVSPTAGNARHGCAPHASMCSLLLYVRSGHLRIFAHVGQPRRVSVSSYSIPSAGVVSKLPLLLGHT